MKAPTIRSSAPTSPGVDPVVDRQPGEVGRREAGRGRDHQGHQHQRHPRRGRGAAGRASSAPCGRAGPRRESAATGRASSSSVAEQAPRLVRLVLGRLRDLGALLLRIALRRPRSLADRRCAAALVAHSLATSSRSSRSRWRKTESSIPCSAISRVQRAALEQLLVRARGRRSGRRPSPRSRRRARSSTAGGRR